MNARELGPDKLFFSRDESGHMLLKSTKGILLWRFKIVSEEEETAFLEALLTYKNFGVVTVYTGITVYFYGSASKTDTKALFSFACPPSLVDILLEIQDERRAETHQQLPYLRELLCGFKP